MFNIRIKHTTIILGLFFLMFIADAINSILVYVNSPFYRASVFVRLLVQIYFIWILLRRSKGRRILFVILVLYVIFAIGTIASLDFFKDYNIFENFIIVNKILFFFLCWQTLTEYFTNTRTKMWLFQVFEWVIWIELITVFAGFMLHLDVFASYSSVDNIRFGYKGLIPAQNETTGFFLIAFFYALWKVHSLHQGTLLLLAVSVANLLTGTKASFALPVILVIYLTYKVIYQLLKGRIRKLYLFIILSIVLTAVVIAINIEYIFIRLEPSISYFRYKINIDKLDYISIIFSGRNWRVQNLITEIIPKWNFLNYLFGGNDLAKIDYLTETDVIDVFVRFGLVGGVLFFYTYLKIFISTIRNGSLIPVLFIITWMSIAASAGHLIYSAINAMYLATLIMAFSSRPALHKGIRNHPPFFVERTA